MEHALADLSLNFDAGALGTPSYGDLSLVDGDLLLTADASRGPTGGMDPIAQAVAQNIRVLLAEYWLDVSLGIPFYEELFGAKKPTIAFETAVQDAILATPGIVSLLAWKLDFKPALRVLVLSFTAQSTVGQVIWSGSINPTVGGGA